MCTSNIKSSSTVHFKPICYTVQHLRYRSIITSFLHASPRGMPRVFHVESAKIYRGNLNFHVTGRGFSTRGLVALHDTWHFHERTHASSTRRIVEGSTRRIMAFPRDESWNFHEMSRGVYSHFCFTCKDQGNPQETSMWLHGL